ncbi:hypothetical protein ACQPZG_14855 [Streptomyces sp. CA-294286]|uniref:hypothetical protein n=1 Tax=Streptomyces sp. CA-294286 TaxID=3240070 RepID=UPI003D921868
MKYTQATAALAGTLVALGSATPAFAHHDTGQGMPESAQVAEGRAQLDEMTGRQLQQVADLLTPQKLLADLKSNVDGQYLRQEAAARAVHPGGPNAVPAPGALLGGLAAGGGPVGIPLDSLT